MITWLVVGVPLLAAAAFWVWSCRDPGTNDQPPWGEPKFTDDRPQRAER